MGTGFEIADTKVHEHPGTSHDVFKAARADLYETTAPHDAFTAARADLYEAKTPARSFTKADQLVEFSFKAAQADLYERSTPHDVFKAARADLYEVKTPARSFTKADKLFEFNYIDVPPLTDNTQPLRSSREGTAIPPSDDLSKGPADRNGSAAKFKLTDGDNNPKDGNTTIDFNGSDDEIKNALIKKGQEDGYGSPNHQTWDKRIKDMSPEELQTVGRISDLAGRLDDPLALAELQKLLGGMDPQSLARLETALRITLGSKNADIKHDLGEGYSTLVIGGHEFRTGGGAS